MPAAGRRHGGSRRTSTGGHGRFASAVYVTAATIGHNPAAAPEERSRRVVNSTPRRQQRRLPTRLLRHSAIDLVLGTVGFGLTLAYDCGASRVGNRTAGDVATGEVLLAHPDERLTDVAQRMLEHGTSHAVVVEPRTGRPVGVLSTLDIAGILGWGLG